MVTLPETSIIVIASQLTVKNSGLEVGVRFKLSGFKTESSSTLMLITSKNQLEISSYFCLMFEKIKFSSDRKTGLETLL